MKIEDVVSGHEKSPEGLAERIRKNIRHKAASLEELSSRYDRGVGQIRQALRILQDKGYHVRIREEAAELLREPAAGGEHAINPKLYSGREYRFGVVSDTHLYSKYARLDVLEALYDIFDKEGVTDVYHAGNLIDGECRFNKHDLVGPSGMNAQLEYAAKNYPARKGIVTHYIVGDDHEGWYAQREGLDVGAAMQTAFGTLGRSDMHYLGYLEADVRLKAPKGDTWLRVMHAGGGSAYALSYAPQKIVESFQGGEKPSILVIGHYHKMEFCIPREVFCISAGCVQDQTPFMRKNKIQAYLGGWVCKMTQAADGHISSLGADWKRFFDKGYYEGEKYRRW